MPSARADRPLADVRVVEFGLYLPTPYAGRLLADLGAVVTKVEPPAGDPIRDVLPGAYEYLNRGKRAIALDLKLDRDRQIGHALIQATDVVIEGFRPGVAARLGIDFDSAVRLRPGLVYCSVSGYGQDGPEAHRPGHDIGFQASGGAFSAALAAHEPPPNPYLPVADLGSGLFAALAIISSLFAERSSPSGAEIYIDLSMQEAIAHFAASRWGPFLVDGRDPDPSDLGFAAPGVGIFVTADRRYVAIAAAEDGLWQRLCLALEAPELAAPPWGVHSIRLRDRRWLRERLEEGFSRYTLRELQARAATLDFPLDVVRGPREVFEDPHLRARGLFHQSERGWHIDFPARLNGRRAGADDRVPDPTADRRAILDELGIAADKG